MKFTTDQLSDRLGVTKVIANGLLRHLVAKGKAKVVEKLKNKTADGQEISGRPTLVYEVPKKVTIDFSEVCPASYSVGTRPRKVAV